MWYVLVHNFNCNFFNKFSSTLQPLWCSGSLIVSDFRTKGVELKLLKSTIFICQKGHLEFTVLCFSDKKSGSKTISFRAGELAEYRLGFSSSFGANNFQIYGSSSGASVKFMWSQLQSSLQGFTNVVKCNIFLAMDFTNNITLW